MHLLGLFADRLYDSLPYHSNIPQQLKSLTFRGEPSRVGHYRKYPPPFFALNAQIKTADPMDSSEATRRSESKVLLCHFTFLRDPLILQILFTNLQSFGITGRKQVADGLKDTPFSVFAMIYLSFFCLFSLLVSFGVLTIQDFFFFSMAKLSDR